MSEILVSVVTITRNRPIFLKQAMNLLEKQYFNHRQMEWIVVDDSNQISDIPPEIDGIVTRYVYKPEPFLSLGEKRDYANSLSTGKYIVVMDDDDYYPPSRVSQAVWTLRHSGCQIAGSSSMLIYFVHDKTVYRFGPYGKNHATCATMAYTKEYADNHSFGKNSYAEEQSFTNGWSEPLAQIPAMKDTIVAISHDNNTIDKRLLLDKKYSCLSKHTVYPYELQTLVTYVDDLKFYNSLKIENKTPSNSTREFHKELDKALEQRKQALRAKLSRKIKSMRH
jgi:glycosyltransferase involved in cell wall biosynthesis